MIAKTIEKLVSHDCYDYDRAAKRVSLEIGEWVAQGDVNFLRISSEILPNLATIETPVQLVPGSTKGSRHCIAERDRNNVKFYEPYQSSTLNCGVMECLGDIEITHPEHKNLILKKGVYAISYQRKYADDLRRSQD